ncbi:MAG TPA: UDP-glucose 4-epimerase GalE [Candidatus Saccharimonadales bacterium]|jgi:UDP-glucose 4-epimerase
MNVLVTGGAGYIGSHTLVELLNAGHTVVVIDNLQNSDSESLERVRSITGKPFRFVEADLRDAGSLSDVFESTQFDAVIHFAGLKSVAESVSKPREYYETNLDSTLVLVRAMEKYRVNKLIFSSSATVYGTPSQLPLTEASRTGTGITNPYGQTKFMIEQILRDIATANKQFEVTLLRYFNPVGAHHSGRIGEDPHGVPNNLLPYVTQVAIGKRDVVQVYGGDYDTVDGTGVRDYIHVVDLARGHLAALQASTPGTHVYNLCSGKGTSVLQLIEAFEVASKKKIPYRIAPRRPGDVAACFANADKARRELGWKTEKSIEQACADSWRWQLNNPNGYKTSRKSNE